MEKIIAENIGKLSAAQNAEETAKILEAAGQTVSEEEAEQIFREIKDHFSDSELAEDELEAVSGGADRDWKKDGCAGTVEANSWCGSNDECHCFEVTYKNAPVSDTCRQCGSKLYSIYLDSIKSYVLKCPNCKMLRNR